MRTATVGRIIKVLIVDDSSTMRAMVDRVLDGRADFKVVGVAASAHEAEDFLNRYDPDIVTLDHEMPGMSGLEFLASIMARRPQRVVMLSSHTAVGAQLHERAEALGAAACFNKADIMRQSDQFLQLLHRVAAHPVRTDLRSTPAP